MTTIRFNAITYANRLKGAKDKSELADIQAEEMSSIINNDLATKQDILFLKQDILSTETKLLNEIKNIKNEMVVRLGSIMVVGMAVLGFILKY